jgi:hypothetical protein
MLRSNDIIVQNACFEIVTMILLPFFTGRNTGSASIEYLRVELTWWLHALTTETLPLFCESVASCVSRALDILGDIGSALTKDLASQNLNCSILMMAALSDCKRESPFAGMVVHVATRMLLFHRDPLPFANFLQSVRSLQGDVGVLSTEHGTLLVQYCRVIVEWQRYTDENLFCLEALVSATLGPGHIFHKFLADVTDGQKISPQSVPSAPCDILATARFYVHLRIISERVFESRPIQRILSQMSPSLISCCRTQFQLLTSQTIKDLQSVKEGSPLSDFDAMLASHPEIYYKEMFSLSPDTADGLWDQTFREKLLALPLLGTATNPGDVLKVQLYLLREPSKDVKIAAAIALALGHSLGYPAAKISLDYDIGVLRDLFQTWWLFPGNRTLPKELSSSLEKYLCEFVANILNTDTIETTYLLTLFTKQDEHAVVDRCVRPDHLSEDSGVRKGRALVLESLLRTDPIRFVPDFLARFSDQIFLDLPIWSEGNLDPAVHIVIDHLAPRSVGATPMASILDAIGSRVISSLKFDNKVSGLSASQWNFS